MSVHLFHEAIQTHGLADRCPRCDEQARSPFESLDRETLRALYARVRSGDIARSVNERRAMDTIADVIWRAHVLESLTPEPIASRKATTLAAAPPPSR